MRHVVIRGLLGLLWLVAALVSGQSENFEMAVFYVASPLQLLTFSARLPVVQAA